MPMKEVATGDSIYSVLGILDVLTVSNILPFHSTSWYPTLHPNFDILICLIRQFDVEYRWIFLRVTSYFDKPLLSNKFKTYIKEKNFRIKYKVLENCMTKRRIRLYIFTRPNLPCAIFSISWIITHNTFPLNTTILIWK